MNVFINSTCNLKCPYCFADHSGKTMTKEDFKFVIDFLRRSKKAFVRLLGGEPTLHPDFAEFINIIDKDESIEHLIVFTNGTFNEEIRELFADTRIKTTLILNFNDESIQGDDNFKRFRENALYLQKYEHIKVVLGLNIYNPDMNYDYFLDLAKKGFEIRWSLTSPSKASSLPERDYYIRLIDKAIQFLDDCNKLGIQYKEKPDCSPLLLCGITAEQAKKMAYLAPGWLSNKKCRAPVDVLPDLQVVRCMATKEFWSADLRRFKDVENIYKFVTHLIDDKGNDIPHKETECSTCPSFISNDCQGGCLAYKLDQIQKERQIDCKTCNLNCRLRNTIIT